MKVVRLVQSTRCCWECWLFWPRSHRPSEVTPGKGRDAACGDPAAWWFAGSPAGPTGVHQSIAGRPPIAHGGTACWPSCGDSLPSTCGPRRQACEEAEGDVTADTSCATVLCPGGDWARGRREALRQAPSAPACCPSLTPRAPAFGDGGSCLWVVFT